MAEVGSRARGEEEHEEGQQATPWEVLLGGCARPCTNF